MRKKLNTKMGNLVFMESKAPIQGSSQINIQNRKKQAELTKNNDSSIKKLYRPRS